MFKFVSILFFYTFCFFSSPSFSATNKGAVPWKKYDSFFTSAPTVNTDYKPIVVSEKQFEKKSLRNAASLNENSFSDEFNSYNDRIKSLKKNQTDEFNKILEDLNTKYSSFKFTETKLLAAFLAPLKTMRGVMWNMGKLAEGQMGQSEMYVSLIRSLYSSADESNNELAELILNYVNTPYEGMIIFNSNRAQANNANPVTPPTIQLQNILGREVYPALVTMTNRIGNLDLSTPVLVDLQAMMPKLPKGYPRFTTFGQSEQVAAIAASELMLARLSVLLAYDYTNFPQFLESSMMGMTQLLSTPVGLLPEKSISKMKEFRVYSLNPYGKEWMHKALEHFRKANENKGKTSSAYMTAYKDLFDLLGKMAKIDLTNEMETSDKESKDVLSGLTPVLDKMTGRLVKMNIPLFFTNPPETYSLLPQDGGYAKGEKYKTVKVNGRTVQMFNPEFGRPEKWNLEAYQPFFPGATEQDLPFIRSTLNSFGIPFAGSIK